MTGWLPCVRRATLTLAFAGTVLMPFGVGADQSDADYDCNDFANQEDAQDFFEEMGGPLNDPHNLDDDNDGVACEEWEREYDQKQRAMTDDEALDRECAEASDRISGQRVLPGDSRSPGRTGGYPGLSRNGSVCEEVESG